MVGYNICATVTSQLLYDGPKADKLATDKLPNAAKLLVEEVMILF